MKGYIYPYPYYTYYPTDTEWGQYPTYMGDLGIIEKKMEATIYRLFRV